MGSNDFAPNQNWSESAIAGSMMSYGFILGILFLMFEGNHDTICMMQVQAGVCDLFPAIEESYVLYTKDLFFLMP